MNLKQKCECLRMVNDQGVDNYIHRVNDIVNAIRSVGGKMEEGDVVRNILLTLLKLYKPKKCSMEECHDLDKYTIDQLLRSLHACEISNMKDIIREIKEIAFDVSKIDEDELEATKNMDEIETNFVRRLKRGVRKYKGKLPLKYFNCDKIDHYASKCMYKQDYKRSDDNEKKIRPNN